MFDPDEQNYTPGGGSLGPESKGFGRGGLESGTKSVGKLIPIIIVIIVVLAVAFFAYTYFASQQDVTITLKDPDGKIVEGRITLKDPQQKTVTTTPSGVASTFSAKIPNGDYSVNATATGYKPVITTITVANDFTSFDLNMTRDLKATINIELDGTDIYEGQSMTGKLFVTNTGQEFNMTDIVSSSDAPLDVKIIYPSTQPLTQGGSAYLDFNVSIKAGTQLKAPKTSTLTFKIKGSDVTAQNPMELNALPSVPASSVTMSASLTNTSLTAGDEKTFQITIRNASKNIPLENLRLEIIPDPDSNDKMEWFRFNEPSTEGNYIKTIDSIDATKNGTATLYVKPPITAKKDDEFKGTLSLTSTSMNGELNAVMNFKVSVEKTAQVNLVGVDSPFTIHCPTDGSACDTKSLSNGEVYLINNGNVDVGPIKVEIVQTPPTTQNCFAYLTNMSTLDSSGNLVPLLSFDSSKLTHKATIILDLTAPAGTTNEVARCEIQWSYIDPLSDPAQTTVNNKIIEINRVVS